MSRSTMETLLGEVGKAVDDARFATEQYRTSRNQYLGIESGSVTLDDATMYLQLASGNPIQIGLPDREAVLNMLASGSTQMLQSILKHWKEINQISAQAVGILEAAAANADQAVQA